MPERRVLGYKLEELPGLAEPLDGDAVPNTCHHHVLIQFLQVAPAHIDQSNIVLAQDRSFKSIL